MASSLADLEPTLARLVEAAKTTWPRVNVDPARFVRFLQARIPTDVDLESALASLHVSDLYLTCACVDGNAEAVTACADLFRSCDAALARVTRDPGVADEVQQLVRTKLFVAENAAEPRIAEYSGRGDLRAYLRVVLVREALSHKRRDRREVALDEDSERASARWVTKDPELQHLRAQYEGEFERVFREAIGELTSEDRNLLRYHYLDGLNIDHIGAIYGIHRVSAARRLTKVRQQLVAGTRRLLSERLRLQSGELESVLRLIESEADISLRRALGEKKSLA